MHTLHDNTDPHTTHQTPSCIALHPHAIQTPIPTDDVHITPLHLCICPVKHSTTLIAETPTTSISGLRVTGPAPTPLTCNQLNDLQLSLIQAYAQLQNLADNPDFILHTQTNAGCILPSGFISLHTLNHALTTATGNTIPHYNASDDISHHCAQLSIVSNSQLHFIQAGHKHDPTHRIFCRPHAPDIKVAAAARFGITTHAAFLPSNCLVTTSSSTSLPPTHVIIPLIKTSFQLSTTLTSIVQRVYPVHIDPHDHTLSLTRIIHTVREEIKTIDYFAILQADIFSNTHQL